MSKIIIFAGTTEGRKLSEWLCQRKIPHTVCVATDYGEQVLQEHPCALVHRGRMDVLQMVAFIKEQQADMVIDATHPYASVVTENLKNAAEETKVNYIRLEREETSDATAVQAQYFASATDCAQALSHTDGNILLTTGSKELELFCQKEEVRARLIVRVLPGKESIQACEEQQILGKQIIAMQGPFSTEMNLALLHQYQIKVLVTKASGTAGGFLEKLQAAEQAQIPVYIIGRPATEKGWDFAAVCKALEQYLSVQHAEVMEQSLTGENAKIWEQSLPREKVKISEQKNSEKEKRKICLIGCGMGHRAQLTAEALSALEQADVFFGAERLLKDMEIETTQYPFYLARDILPYLETHGGNVAILFSGDTGFYSGAAKLYAALQKAVANKTVDATLEIYPGISSVSQLAAAAGVHWEDAKIISVHGKGSVENWAARLLGAVRKHAKTFLLLSGVKDLQAIGHLLQKHGLADCTMIVGYQMSYPEEEIRYLSPKKCTQRTQEGLYSLLILNDHVTEHVITPGIQDTEFIRGNVPMTKEEVRTVSISKLGVWSDAVVYDIGSGTGSVTVEMARLSEKIQVYAIEQKQDAIELTRQNIQKFGLENVRVIEGKAPEVLADLPAPSHVFIGGSGGQLQDIVTCLLQKNPSVRIVANAVSYETLQEFLQIEEQFPVEDFQMVTLSAVRTKKLAGYHMMQSENPIFICSLKGKGQ